MNENGTTGSSPYCGSILEKSIVRPSTRAGVPVLKRRTEKPRSTSDCVSFVAQVNPCGPPCQSQSPMMMRLFRYTPQASTIARQAMTAPVVVSRPVTWPFSVSMRAASP